MPPLVPVTLAVVLGILLAPALPCAWPVLVALGVAAGGASLVAKRTPLINLVGVLVVWGCAGALRTRQWTARLPGDIAGQVSSEPRPVAVHGVVVNDPTELFSPNEPERQVCVVAVRHVRVDRSWQPAEGLLRARLDNSRVRLAQADEVLLEGRWSSVPPPGNPGQFDWRAALARQRIHALLTVKPYDGVVRLAHPALRVGVIGWARQRLEARIREAFGGFHGALLRSFVLGQRAVLPDGLKRAFVETGTMHLVVVSGFNVGLIALLLELALRWLGVSRSWRLVGTAAGLLGYCLLTGSQPPVLRATLMAWVVLGAAWMDRVVHWPTTLAAAALAILGWNPMQLFDPGFQLSFGAVLSLWLLTPPVRRVLEPLTAGIRPQWLGRYLSLGTASTVAVSLGLWPVLAWYFHLYSLVSIAANLVLVPLVSLLVSAGTALLTIGLVVPAVLRLAAGGLVVLMEAIVGCVTVLHRVPGGWWLVGQLPPAVVAGYYGLLALTLLAHPLRLRSVPLLMAWLIGLNVWVWPSVARTAAEARWLELTVLDVGHGDSLVIRTPDGQTLVVDAGSREAGRTVVAPFLQWKGWPVVDALVLTHFDEDHIGGAAALLRQAAVRRLLTNGGPGRTPTAQRLLRLADTRHIPQQPLSAGQRLTSDRRVSMTVLHPPSGFVPDTDPSSNDNSVVLRLAFDRISLLLCGDLETRGLPWLMRWKALGSTVLKVPHHGSALGPLGQEFLARVHPELAVISVGRRPGLPSEEVLAGLARVGAQVRLTRRDGAVTVRTDGRRLEVETFRASGAW